MPLVAADIKFFAAAVNTDATTGGGPRSANLVQNGVLNNFFPAVSASDRLTGKVNLRKLYPSLTNTDTTPLLGATLGLNEAPSDPLLSCVLFATGDSTTTRAQAVTGIGTRVSGAMSPAQTGSTFTSISEFGERIDLRRDLASYLPVLGERVALFPLGLPNDWTSAHQAVVTIVGADYSVPSGSGGTVQLRSFTISPPAPSSWTNFSVIRRGQEVISTPAYGATKLTALAAAAQPVIVVASVSAPLVPYSGSGNYPTADVGFPPAGLAYSGGRVPILRAGDTVSISDELATSSSTAVVGTAIPSGRTNADQLAIVGANGVEIVRLLAGGPTSTLATANFVTGTITPATVAGWSQPVTVRGRVAQRTTVTGISGLNVTLADNLVTAMPVGSLVSSEMPLGDLQARAATVFAQQAWTRQWSDSLIGNAASLPYNGDIAVTNAGADTDRYAVVFNSGTTFTVYSERRGLLSTGTTTANYLPLNPATGVALFTLLSANWNGTAVVGNVLRFNTFGALPVWAARTIIAGAASGTDRAVIRMYGSA
jgi:hypothetical protein